MTGELVGRDRERATIATALAKGTRVIAVSGAAGVGKTALAALIAREHKGLFCNLATVTSHAALITSVAGALGIPLPPEDEGSREERLLRALRGRSPVVVVFDNAERCGEVVSQALRSWVPVTPTSLTFLVTSQLRVAGAEEVLFLEPLLLPDANTGTRGDALKSPAVQLFVQRASERTGFIFSDEDVADVVALVRALDGLPLALILCASRMGLVGVKRTRELLSRRFELLVDHDTSPEARHRSLESALAWSWELLAPSAKHTLACASVFRDGFSLEAAHAVVNVVDDENEGGDELRTLAELELLLGASFLILTAPPVMGAGARFGIYESVHDFALRMAPAQVVHSARERHARYFISAGEAWAARVTTAEGIHARRWLSVEQANLVAVAETAPDPCLALRAALILETTYLARGPAQEHVARIKRLIGVVERHHGPKPEAPALIARATLSLGLAEMFLGQRSSAIAHFRDAVTRSGDDAATAGLASSKASLLLGLSGAYEESRRFWANAEGLAARSGSPHLVGIVAMDRGMVLSESGDNRAAIAAFETALVGFRAAENKQQEAFTLAALAGRYIDDGALAEAKRNAERAATMLLETGDQRTYAYTQMLLGLVALDDAHTDAASTYAERAVTILRSLGDRLTEGSALAVVGHAALEDGRVREATDFYATATALLEGGDDRRNAAIVNAAWAAASAIIGERTHAERLMARAEAHEKARGRPGDRDALQLFSAVLRARSVEEWAAHGEREKVKEGLAAIDALIARVADPSSGVHKSDEVRLALRVARRVRQDVDSRIDAMLESAAAAPSARRPAVAGIGPLIVADDGSWFRLPNGEVKKLRGRPVAARLLRSLVDRALQAPGLPLDSSKLIEAGWPEEKILPKAAQNRLYVAMTRLRQLGLGELLRNEGDGYFLAADLPVRIARDAPPGGAAS